MKIVLSYWAFKLLGVNCIENGLKGIWEVINFIKWLIYLVEFWF